MTKFTLLLFLVAGTSMVQGKKNQGKKLPFNREVVYVSKEKENLRNYLHDLFVLWGLKLFIYHAEDWHNLILYFLHTGEDLPGLINHGKRHFRLDNHK